MEGKSIDTENNTKDDTTEVGSDPKINNDVNAKSHGATVASIIASPINSGAGSHLSGFIPGAPIYPVKLKDLYEHTMASGIYLAADSPAIVINASLGLPDHKPISFSPTIGLAIYYATHYNNKPVIIPAGNTKINLDSVQCPTGSTGATNVYPGCIDYGQVTVGGSDEKGLIWDDGTNGSAYGKAVDLSASSYYIYSSSFRPAATNSYGLYYSSGTSLSAPMVAATLGMMKKAGEHLGYNLTSKELRDLVTYSGSISRSTCTIVNGNCSNAGYETKFLGKNLYNNNINTNLLAGIRELNVYNA
ncbi:hypothetical protein EON78_05455, partial [bacterium]